MNQSLYTQQDNEQLNAKIEQISYPRGENPAIQILDDAGYFKPENLMVKPADEGVLVKQANGPAVHFTPEQIRAAQEQVQNGGAVVLDQNGGTSMFSNIKDMYTKDPAPTKVETYFVAGKGKVQFGIDRTVFAPSSIVRLSGKNFEQKYLEQLESYVFNNQSELDPEKLLELIQVMSVINEGNFPIKVVTGKFRIQLPKIVKVLNTYYNKNRAVLKGIASMFNGISTMPQQTETKAE